MSNLCNASLPEQVVKVTEEKQLEESWEAPGLQRDLEQAAEPLRKWELGQKKALNPSVGFQHHRKFAFSPWSKAILCGLGPGGSILCCVLTGLPQAGLKFLISPKKQQGGGFTGSYSPRRCCCARAAVRSFKRDAVHWWGLHSLGPLRDGCCPSPGSGM